MPGRTDEWKIKKKKKCERWRSNLRTASVKSIRRIIDLTTRNILELCLLIICKRKNYDIQCNFNKSFVEFINRVSNE